MDGITDVFSFMAFLILSSEEVSVFQLPIGVSPGSAASETPFSELEKYPTSCIAYPDPPAL